MGVHEWWYSLQIEGEWRCKGEWGDVEGGVWRVIQRLLKQDWGHANVVWDHTSSKER